MAADLVVVIDRARIDQINAEHPACEASASTAVQHAMRCGELLTAVRRELKHGEWLPWINKHFAGDERTARAYMQLHRELSNRQRAADLKIPADQLPSSIRAALKEISKPKPKPQARDAYALTAGVEMDTSCPPCRPRPARRSTRAIGRGARPPQSRSRAHLVVD